MSKLTDYQIIDAVAASIYWKDLSGKYLGCNQYMTKMAGLAREEIIGNSDFYLPWWEQANKIAEIDQLVISTRAKYELEEKIKITGGASKIFLSSKTPLFNEAGEITGVIGVSIDVTRDKLLEQEFERTEQALDKYSTIKTRFLQNISHEVRIPMSSVLSISEILVQDWQKYDEQTKFDSVNLVFQEAKRLSSLIVNSFDMSSFIKGDVQLKLTKQNFSTFLQEILTEYKANCCDDQIEIILDVADNCTFVFDQELIRRVIENILLNAIRYS